MLISPVTSGPLQCAPVPFVFNLLLLTVPSKCKRCITKGAPFDMEMKNIACHGCQTPYPRSDGAGDISYRCLCYCLGIQRESCTDRFWHIAGQREKKKKGEKRDGSRSQSLFPWQHQCWHRGGEEEGGCHLFECCLRRGGKKKKTACG